MLQGGLDHEMLLTATRDVTGGLFPAPITSIPAMLAAAASTTGAKFVKVPYVAGYVRKVLYQTSTAGVVLSDGSEHASCRHQPPVGSLLRQQHSMGALSSFDAFSRSCLGDDSAAAVVGVGGGGGAGPGLASQVIFCLHREVFEKYPLVLEAGSALVLSDVTAISPPAAPKNAASVIVCLRNVKMMWRAVDDSVAGDLAPPPQAFAAPAVNSVMAAFGSQEESATAKGSKDGALLCGNRSSRSCYRTHTSADNFTGPQSSLSYFGPTPVTDTNFSTPVDNGSGGGTAATWRAVGGGFGSATDPRQRLRPEAEEENPWMMGAGGRVHTTAGNQPSVSSLPHSSSLLETTTRPPPSSSPALQQLSAAATAAAAPAPSPLVHHRDDLHLLDVHDDDI
jgi:hypothetical protein